ncbi:glycoside hydrolase family 15 protein [Patescibacteria group bacterium]|nr:glycoside hydrolase family 15 protein [Patescibacteria group bacterium]MBU2260144.1 glycoside hydrolase family 15 protein [Patescibacteria group bacterium]
MPRSLVLGNGSILVTYDDNLQMRDLYFPHVGMEDHTAYGDMHRTGVWVASQPAPAADNLGGAAVKDGKFAWFDDPSWEVSINYKHETLVGSSRLRNEKLGIQIDAEDFVHPVLNVIMRSFHVQSIDGKEKEVRLFYNHDFHIYGDKQKDTAFYEPYTNSVIHYRQTRYFLVGGETSDPVECHTGHDLGAYQSTLHSTGSIKHCGISGYSIGKADYQGREGTWRDAEDGNLSGVTVDQGSVDSTVGIYCKVSPDRQTTVSLWICCGKSLEEVIGLHQEVIRESPVQLQRNCHNYWKSWVNKTNADFGDLPAPLIDLYKRSLLLIRLHVDNQGGIIAAADADIMEFNRDTYTYVWPRDGAFVCMALDKAKYPEVTRRFFEFCCKVQMPDGYLLHKYNPDGSPGSSWHPWYRDGKPQLPIQEDETALVLCALCKHFESSRDFEFLQYMYENFLKKAAQFLVDFREEKTGLPLMSYDLWEEHRGIFSYTTSCVIAGLYAAAHISNVLGHFTHSERYHNAADEMKQAMLFHLYDEEHQRFVKKIKREDGNVTNYDLTPDMSIAAVWKLGVLPPHDPRIVSTMKQLEDALRVHTDIGGFARYTNDVYHAKAHSTKKIPGNPWFITTLWSAQWHIALAKKPEDLKEVLETLKWVEAHKSEDGILAEQLDPFTGKPLSVAPLVWSHATYVETVQLYLEKLNELTARNVSPGSTKLTTSELDAGQKPLSAEA